MERERLIRLAGPSFTIRSSSPCILVRTWTRLVHIQRAPFQRHTLQSRDRRLCLCARGHVDKPEASGFPAELVANNGGGDHVPKGLKHFS